MSADARAGHNSKASVFFERRSASRAVSIVDDEADQTSDLLEVQCHKRRAVVVDTCTR